MPDFTGKSMREVLEYCSILGIEASFSGEGYVVEQEIPPGTPIGNTKQVSFRLEPH